MVHNWIINYLILSYKVYKYAFGFNIAARTMLCHITLTQIIKLNIIRYKIRRATLLKYVFFTSNVAFKIYNDQVFMSALVW